VGAYGGLDELAGATHRFIERHRGWLDWDKQVELRAQRGRVVDRAGDADDLLAETPRESGDADGPFALQALFIESAFAGDDEVGGSDAGFESDLRRDHVEAADETSAEESHETETESASGAGARHIARIDAEVAAHEVGEMFKSLFEPGEIGDPFLRAVDARGATGAE
jgi:hypothetical protein